ncbi:uroporphyrinogen-III synthase [Arthrobacter sp. TPD3018]|uniref:uroporphyrinogen-III synthase n=1 Tax=Bacteria TaxID=2 RepID=UPI000D50ADD5|nr:MULTISPECIES: uroporphyrinogen-III synthase [Bacteria]PVE59083.1 uroporphyrinogen-III synthase [Sphingomonas sp. TPD3009]PVE60606.1 uroporphyrinogen-III synthase [Arthrobacter sp. TPD3018]PVE87282.1 uroporphyrinogen-III synthase [Sphingomonas melonis]
MTGLPITGLLVVRPEPGTARTLARLRALGVDAAAVPLFATVPVPWQAPDPAAFDALLITSANAVRHAGPALARLAHLPVIAVGAQTAEAARAAGLTVAVVGTGGVAEALGPASFTRPLHLAGRDHVDSGHPTRIVYASDAIAVDPAAFASAARQRIVLLHSVRAATRVAALLQDRSATGIAALSPAVRAAAGDGWACAITADTPTDAALCRVGAAACTPAIDPAAGAGDKAP